MRDDEREEQNTGAVQDALLTSTGKREREKGRAPKTIDIELELA